MSSKKVSYLPEEVEAKFQQIDQRLEELGTGFAEFRERSIENTQNIFNLQSLIGELGDIVRSQTKLIAGLYHERSSDS